MDNIYYNTRSYLKKVVLNWRFFKVTFYFCNEQ